MIRTTILALGLALAAGQPVAAQPKVKVPAAPVVKQLGPSAAPRGGRTADDSVPRAFLPPPGMCRIWLDGVPAGQQPAPTDCASAVRNRPANGRVLFGDDYARSARARDRRPTAEAPPERASAGDVVVSQVLAAWAARAAAPDLDEAPDAEGSATWRLASWTAPNQDSTARRRTRPRPSDVRPPGERRPLTPDPRLRRDDDDDDGPAGRLPAGASATDRAYEEGYAAGYEDAQRGRRRTPGGRRAAREDGAMDGARGAGVVVVPQGDDPRYYNNGRYAPPGRANGVCLDRDADGWCDDPRFGAPVCRDLDGDGRCDDYAALAAAPYPSAMPEMRAGVDVQRGVGAQAALRWLGTSEVVARVSDPRRTGSPYRVLWYDANTNALLQAWTDRDGDGIADRVEIFRNGRLVKLLGR